MDKAPEDKAVAKSKEGATISPKPDAAYDFISRSLSEEDLKNPAVVRMIINERDRLQAENIQMKDWQNKYYTAETQSKILEEKMKKFNAFEAMSTGMVGGGFLLLGVGINPLNWAYLTVGFILVVVGIIAKLIKIV